MSKIMEAIAFVLMLSVIVYLVYVTHTQGQIIDAQAEALHYAKKTLRAYREVMGR